MSDSIEVSIIIVNYNTCRLTCQCLDSIYSQVNSVNYEVILVDNASTDNSVAEIKRNFPGVKLITSDVNLGFGRANNLGARNANGKFLFLLNSDTILRNDPFVYFIDFYSQISKPAVIGTYLVDSNNDYTKSAGTFYSIRKYLLMALRRYFPYFPSHEEVPFQDKVVPVDYVIGADMFVDKNLFKRIGGFDEHIFMYFEDVEFCKRLASLGLQSYVIPGPDIVHFVKASSTSQFSRIYNMASLMYCLRKEVNRFRFNLFQWGLFFLKCPLLLDVRNLRDNLTYLSVIFKYKKYILTEL